ncbi:MAG: hypothetical protein JSR89_01725 [Proteobacteria bacterium]|nr:hypothetical protein [Pseudomonadota bacterium]
MARKRDILRNNSDSAVTFGTDGPIDLGAPSYGSADLIFAQSKDHGG